MSAWLLRRATIWHVFRTLGPKLLAFPRHAAPFPDSIANCDLALSRRRFDLLARASPQPGSALRHILA